MSKRHQSSRRKTYGRRQHELRERAARGYLVEPVDFAFQDDGLRLDEPISLFEVRLPRLRYAVGE